MFLGLVVLEDGTLHGRKTQDREWCEHMRGEFKNVRSFGVFDPEKEFDQYEQFIDSNLNIQSNGFRDFLIGWGKK